MNLQTDHAANGRELLKLLRQYEQYYRELQRLAEQQRALIQAKQTEELLTILSQRQKVVQAIGVIHGKMANYRTQWPEIKSSLPAELACEIETLLSTLQTMLNDILTNDQKDCEELVSQKGQVHQELNVAARGNAASHAYGAGGAMGNARRPSSAGLEISG